MFTDLLHLFILIHLLCLSGNQLGLRFVNANVEVVRYARNDRALQLGAAIATIALLLLPGLYNPATSSTFASDPLYSLVLVWAFYGVHKELAKAPLEGEPSEWCPPLVSTALSGVAALMAAGLLATVLLRLLAWAVARKRTVADAERGTAAAPVYPRFVERSDDGKARALGSI